MTDRVKIIICLIVVLGAGLRVRHYASDSSLWLDEVAVARPILERPLRSLVTEPLPYSQVAPRGFLLVEKLAVNVLGPSDLALRLFPFLASVTGLVLVALVAVRQLDPRGAVTATFAAATAAPLIFFGSQVKQYSSDAAASVLIVALLCLRGTGTPERLSWRRAALAAVVGGVIVWISQSAVLVLAGTGIALLVMARRDGQVGWRRWHSLAFVLAVWGGSALAVTLAGLRSMSPATREYMHRFWADGFMPLSIQGLIDRRWPVDAILTILGAKGQGLGFPLAPLYSVMGGLGCWVLWRRNRRLAWLLTAPIGVAVAAAAVQQYPFSGRLLLYLVPTFLILIAQGVSWIAEQAGKTQRWAGHLAHALLLGPMIAPVLVRPPPYRIEDLKPVLAYVQRHRQPSDRVYVYYGAGPAFSFYGQSFGFGDDTLIAGECHRGSSGRYFDELDALRGQPRAWIIMTHAGARYREREDILGYLDTIGRRSDFIEVPSRTVGFQFPPALAVLYDLSDPSRLAAATARTYHATGPQALDGRFTCGEGPQAMRMELLVR